MNLIKVGIVGTGYAATKRAEAIQNDPRAVLVSITGNSPEKIQDCCENFSISPVDSWQKLVSQPELDLIFVCTINRDHGAVARAAIEAGKHVVVEYPLSLDAKEAAEIIALAERKNKLLHVEHIELIGGLHQTMKQHLADIRNVFYARYTTIAPQRQVAPSWKYHREMFGFPLAAALSRIHRLTDLFGDVAKVSCQNRYWDVPDTDYFTACLCNAQLTFTNGIVADITYGKGDIFWYGHRTFEIWGDRGTLLFEGEKGTLIRDKERIALTVNSRRGLFAKDTEMVLDYLTLGKPLYLQPSASLYAIEVANLAEQSSITNTKVSSDRITQKF
ncbi:MAG: Gfo/Idh/MocA family oxidoreductase [Xenococcaceae cyanobacterium MO_207.B15]|nr:Gfo/Idh/MocA family oxidoreductase [Xenococcaceae cyanobacterium MO_207.B15]